MIAHFDTHQVYCQCQYACQLNLSCVSPLAIKWKWFRNICCLTCNHINTNCSELQGVPEKGHSKANITRPNSQKNIYPYKAFEYLEYFTVLFMGADILNPQLVMHKKKAITSFQLDLSVFDKDFSVLLMFLQNLCSCGSYDQ